MDEETKKKVDAIVEFLSSCGNADIEAGVGQIYGFGSSEGIQLFEQGLATALRPQSP